MNFIKYSFIIVAFEETLNLAHDTAFPLIISFENFEKLSFFKLRHYCQNFSLLIGSQTVWLSWQGNFLSLVSTESSSRF